jgi:hypothetical protein
VALPAAQRHVALDHRALAAELDQAAVVGAVLGGEVARLVERGAVAALVRGAAEQGHRPPGVVELGHRAHARQREHEVHERLGHVVGLRRAAGDVHDRDAALDFQFQPR